MTDTVLGLLSGLVFGYIITRVGATNPDKMARSHLMLDSSIPKFMLMAVLAACVGLTGLVAVGRADTVVLPTSLVATGLAAIIFGIGWGMTGYCPGTSWAAAGEGRMDAVFALLGGFAGTLFFAHFHEVIIPAIYMPTFQGSLTVHETLGLDRWAGTLLLAAGLAAGILAIHLLWRKTCEE